MFVQVIEGRAGDVDGIRRQAERWQVELRPGATGYLGTTGGVTDDGTCIVLVRFASEADARANSERSAQGEWWAETEKCFDGEVSFRDSDDVETWLAGGSDDAAFVQVMKGRAQREQVRALDRRFEEIGPTWRPDVIGGVRVWLGPDEYLEAVYFTSEADARANEQKPPPPELAAEMEQFQELMAGVTFLDLKEPWLL